LSWQPRIAAGKRKRVRVNKGNFRVKAALVQAAQAAKREKGTYLREKYYRVKARWGAKRAGVTIAHKILLAVYHRLSDLVSYNDLGDLNLDRLTKQHLTRSLVRRLQRWGWNVNLKLAA
jgi:transposase